VLERSDVLSKHIWYDRALENIMTGTKRRNCLHRNWHKI